jgi:hypothetical protein
MDTVYFTQEIHVPLSKNKWNTSLYNIDTESCIMSICLPCHIYSKVLTNVRSYYKYCFILMTIFYFFYYSLLFGMNYIPSLSCNGYEIITCVGQTSITCNEYYITVNNDSYQCFWSDSIDLCIPTTNERCVQQNVINGNMITIYTCFTIFSLLLFYINYKFRTTYEDNHFIERGWDTFISLFCSICSNAQIYREREYDLEQKNKGNIYLV